MFHRSLIANYPLQDVQKHMLGKEWLAKVDNETSTPYLLVSSVVFIVKSSHSGLIRLATSQKFHVSESEPACSLMITDTKSVWFERASNAPDLFHEVGLKVTRFSAHEQPTRSSLAGVSPSQVQDQPHFPRGGALARRPP